MANIKIYADKGLTGLVNMGNTCFVNTCIQILSHTYELNELLDSMKNSKHIKNIPDSLLLVEWNNLRKLMWKQNCVIEPGKFIYTMQNVAKVKKAEIFSGFSQNDISEFLLFIVDCFHNSIARPVSMSIKGNGETTTDNVAIKVFTKIKEMYSKEYSEVWNLFYGMHVSQITSSKTNKLLSQTPEPFFTISLPIPKGKVMTTLYECFDEYVKGEALEGDNGWINEKTKKKEDVVKNIVYWTFPNILSIDLKRAVNNHKKNQQLVSFPLNDLDLRKYAIGYRKNEYIYELYGICNHHSGTSIGGHYTGIIKNANQKWYEFNDVHINEVHDIKNIITPKAYCLFYRKKANYNI